MWPLSNLSNPDNSARRNRYQSVRLIAVLAINVSEIWRERLYVLGISDQKSNRDASRNHRHFNIRKPLPAALRLSAVFPFDQDERATSSFDFAFCVPCLAESRGDHFHLLDQNNGEGRSL